MEKFVWLPYSGGEVIPLKSEFYELEGDRLFI